MPFLDPEGDGVRILSLDGGDGRCLSQLLMLEELLHRLEYDHGRSVRPCEFFHSITGVGAAGVIAILLGVLGMTIEDALKAFVGICEKVFAADVRDEASRSRRLLLAMKSILDELDVPRMTRMEGDIDRGAGCQVSICYSSASINGCRMFRNYKSKQVSYNPTIVEAARASWATPGLFSSIRLGSPSRKEEIISAVNGFNNPTREAVREAKEALGTKRPVSTVLSLGSGVNGPISIHSSGFLQDTVQQTNVTEDDIERELGLSGIYFRFSPDHTFQNKPFTVDSNWLGSITSYTRGYLERVKTIRSMEGFLEASAHTSNANLELRGEVRLVGVAPSPKQPPATSRLSRDEKIILSELRVTGLQCGSPLTGCMEGTREDILKRINAWATNFDSPNILWLKGHPGVGKSAIAAELVEQLRALGRLGSSFFFQRQNAAVLTPNALWRTVAYDLARRHPTIRRTIVAILEAEEVSPATANIERLFHHFIHEPLIGSAGIPNARLPVVVIDALDECGGLDVQRSGHRRDLVRTVQNWSRLPSKYKLVVTSRGENDIERLFSTVNHHPIEILAGQMVDAQSSEDIRLFLTEQLQQVSARYSMSLSPTWPGTQIVKQLADRAAGLFIWAETAVKFISLGEPQRRLSHVLEGRVSGNIDDLYEQILRTSFRDPSEEDINDFRSVVGTIIVAKAPLSFSSLSHLLSMPESSVEHICSGLQSVLEFHGILRFHHQSFVDFLLKQDKGTSVYFIEPVCENQKITLACFRVMKERLRFNICSLKSSHFRNVDILDLESRAEENIPPHLLYSCCWWACHLAETKFDAEAFVHVRHFMYKQFLCCLEVLSIIKRVNLGSQMLSSLMDWIPSHGQNDALAMSRDMQKFLAAFASVISQSVAHIYLSALPFSPQISAVSKQYTPDYPNTLVIQGGGLSNWPAIQNVLTGHYGPVLSVAFSPDGKRIVSGSRECTIRVWDTDTGDMVAGPFGGHYAAVTSVAFSPDGKRIASGSHDQTIGVWDAETGVAVAGPFKGHSEPISSVAFSPDGKHIISGSYDKTIRVWDAEGAGVVAGPFEGHGDGVTSVDFSSDGKYVASGSRDNTVCVWDAKTGGMVAGPFKRHSNCVSSVAFSPDNKRIVSGSWDNTIYVWDAKAGGVVAGPFKGHSNWVSSVAFSPDGKRIVSGSYDNTIRLWDTETGRAVASSFERHGNTVKAVSFSPDGKRIISGSWDHTICVWDAETSGIVAGPLEGHENTVTSVAFSPDGKRIVSASHDKTMRIWDAETGAVVSGPFEGHSNAVMSVGFSPDGKRIVSGSRDRTIRVWDVETCMMVAGPFEGGGSYIDYVAFSPDGMRIVSGCWNREICLWDAEMDGVVIGPLQRLIQDVTSVAISPDGKRIVSGFWDNTIRVWDAKTGGAIAGSFKGHYNSVTSIGFSPDGRRIVSGSWDHTVRVWNAETGEVVAGPFEGHEGQVNSVMFSPDGKCIVSCADDRKIHVWDAETGGMVAGPFEGHSCAVSSVAFSPDGKRIVSGSLDKTIRVWDTQIHDSKVKSQTLWVVEHCR